MLGKALLLLAFVAYQGSAQTPWSGEGVQTGGRLCNSGLRIFPHTMNWDTTYSDCKNTPYDTIEHGPNHFVYRLHPTSKHCLFRILVVDYSVEAEGWNTTGFTTETAWRQHDSNKELPCGPMY